MTLINVDCRHRLHRRRGRAGQLRPSAAASTIPPGSIKPDLRSRLRRSAVVIAPNGTRLHVELDRSPARADPVSAVLMHDNVLNEFVLDAGTKSGTDWVVTFPTKRYYVNVGTGNAPKLFQRNFNRTDGSCDDVIAEHLRPRRAHDQHADRRSRRRRRRRPTRSAGKRTSSRSTTATCWARRTRPTSRRRSRTAG